MIFAHQAVSQAFALWHPALVHLPLGLLFLAVPLELFAYFKQDSQQAKNGHFLLTLGTVGLLFTFITGIYAELVAARASTPQYPLGLHEAFATAATWLFIGLTTFRSAINHQHKKAFVVYLILLVLAGGFLGATGWQGGKLVYQYAAGVIGVKPPIAPTPQDLANLTRTNTQDELDYSDMMHHIFGWVTLGLAFWLAYLSSNLPYKEKIQGIGPVLLTGSGLFLMLFSDWDSWPWDTRVPITDPEVLFHKVLATIMIFCGIGMNLARKKESILQGALQAKILAALALIGGGMLFTHVHTGAPYTDIAEGIYLQHFVVGCVALACGTAKTLEAHFPGGQKIWDRCWIVLLFVASANLLWYKEGCPWYYDWLETQLSHYLR